MSDASAKGRALELHVAAQIRRKGLDKGARRMPRSGAIDGLAGDVRSALPYSLECKCQERVQLWEWFDQARAQARMGRPPVLAISGDNRPVLVVCELDTFLDLEKVRQDYYADIPERPKLGQRVR